MTQPGRLDAGQVVDFDRDGFVILRQFANEATTSAIHDAAVALARREPVEAASGANEPFVLPEANLRDVEVTNAEEAVSKVFRVHRDEPFRSFATRDDLVASVIRLLGVNTLSCFLSQFIFKNPGAWGQPCHQDSLLLPVHADAAGRGRVAGVHRRHAENGCLWVVPG